MSAAATPTDRPLAQPRPAADVGAWTVTSLARWWACKPHVILALNKGGELRAINIAAPGAKRPHWRIRPDDLDAFEFRRAAVPAAKSMPRRKKTTKVDILDPATGKVRRELGVVGSAAMQQLRQECGVVG